MKVLVSTTLAVIAVSAWPQANPTTNSVTILGTLELVDKPAEATPVEAFLVRIIELHGSAQFAAKPDRDGNFRLENVRPGNYVLNLNFPGRIQLFVNGSHSLMPDGFEVQAGDSAPMRIVVSEKTSTLSVGVAGISDNKRDIVALLSPGEPYLTLQSNILNPVSEQHTQFRFVVPGSYTLLIFDSEFQRAVGTSAAVRNALRNKATAVQVRDAGETKVTATYVQPDVVKQAINQAAPNK
jgi:hypothetical protein